MSWLEGRRVAQLRALPHADAVGAALYILPPPAFPQSCATTAPSKSLQRSWSVHAIPACLSLRGWRPRVLNTSLVFSGYCSQNSAGWRGWKGDKCQSSTSRQTQQSTHNKYIHPQMQTHQKRFLPRGSERSRLRQESSVMRWVRSRGLPRLLWPLGFVQALEGQSVTLILFSCYYSTIPLLPPDFFHCQVRKALGMMISSSTEIPLVWYQDWQLGCVAFGEWSELMLTLSAIICVPLTQAVCLACYALQWAKQQPCAAENVWKDHVPQLPKCLPK